MSNYTTVKAALSKHFAEPSGVVNSETILALLESASKKVIPTFKSSTPSNSEVLLTFVAPVDMTFKAGLADSAAEAGTGATAEAVFNLATDGGAAWGTITFAAAGTTAPEDVILYENDLPDQYNESS